MRSFLDIHPVRSRRVAEHVEEDGLGEGVELGEGGAALGPQRVRLVQDLRNPPLLGERAEEESKLARLSRQRLGN